MSDEVRNVEKNEEIREGSGERPSEEVVPGSSPEGEGGSGGAEEEERRSWTELCPQIAIFEIWARGNLEICPEGRVTTDELYGSLVRWCRKMADLEGLGGEAPSWRKSNVGRFLRIWGKGEIYRIERRTQKLGFIRKYVGVKMKEAGARENPGRALKKLQEYSEV